jgi:transposase
MTSKQYIKHLTAAEGSIRGKDVPQKSCAGVIDGLCDVIASKDAAIAEKDTVIASKDADIAKMNQTIKLLQRQLYGRRSEKLHPDDPNWLSLDFGEEQVQLPVSDDELKEAEQHVSEAVDGVRKDADARRVREKERGARQRKGMTYRIPAGIPRKEPVCHYPEGYTPETMTVIGWNKHEYLEMEKPRMYVRQEWDAICKAAGAKPTDAHTQIVEAHDSQNCLPGCIAGKTIVSTIRPLMAAIVTDKWCHHLPEYRQVKRLAAMGVTLSTTSINRWQHALANRLFPLYEIQMELVLSSPYQHVDESTIPVNDQKHHTRKGYIWGDVDGMLEYGLVWYPPRDTQSRGPSLLRQGKQGREGAEAEAPQAQGCHTVRRVRRVPASRAVRAVRCRDPVLHGPCPPQVRGHQGLVARGTQGALLHRRALHARGPLDLWSLAKARTSGSERPPMTRYAPSGRRRPCPYSPCSGSCWRSTRPWTHPRAHSHRPAARPVVACNKQELRP